MVKLKTGAAMAICAFALSGCVVTGPGGGGKPVPPRAPTFAEGNWQQEDIASYTFGNGSFIGTATDTGNRLSDGTYRYTSANQVNITGTSAIRGTSFSANCLVVSGGNALNCTTQTGAQFTLNRRGSFS